MTQVDSDSSQGERNNLVDLGELLHYLARGQQDAAVLQASLGKQSGQQSGVLVNPTPKNFCICTGPTPRAVAATLACSPEARAAAHPAGAQAGLPLCRL